jgi:serine/threonine protein kinase
MMPSKIVMPSPEVIFYKKGEKRTSELVPKGQVVGAGVYGKVYEYRDQSHLVVKRSGYDLLKEHRVGLSLDHPCIVKMGSLFVKEYPQGETKSRMVMTKIIGNTGEKYLLGKAELLSIGELCKVMLQAKECCLYLLEKKVAWSDLNLGNIFITEEGKNLVLCDLGLWTQASNDSRWLETLFFGSVQLADHLLYTAFCKIKRDERITVLFSSIASEIPLDHFDICFLTMIYTVEYTNKWRPKDYESYLA